MKAPQKSLAKTMTGLFAQVFAASPAPWLPSDTPYPALVRIEPETMGLVRAAGVYALWHLGVRPRWLRVGGGDDLAALLAAQRHDPEVEIFNANGGVYCAWALLALPQIPAVLASLTAQLQPVLRSSSCAGAAVAAEPGTQPFPLPPGSGSRTPPAG